MGVAGGGLSRIAQKKYTSLFVVVVLLAATDIVFAVDSIPAVFGITQDKMVIYTSNIFAVLGLRSLFFLLKDAVDRFRYLPQGIAVVLVFVGLKMLAGIWGFSLPAYLSLLVILVCLGAAIFTFFSVLFGTQKKSMTMWIMLFVVKYVDIERRAITRRYFVNHFITT